MATGNQIATSQASRSDCESDSGRVLRRGVGADALWPQICSRSPGQGGSARSLHPVPPPSPPRAPGPEGGRTEFPSAGALAYPASQQALSVYGEKGEMEKAGRRLASAAPPRSRFRRRESGARSARVPQRPIARFQATAARPRDASTPGSGRQATRCLLSPVSGRARGTLG